MKPKTKNTKSKIKPVVAWACLVPTTLVPYSVLQSSAAIGTRQYILFADKDGKEQAERLALNYPESQRIVCKVKITPYA